MEENNKLDKIAKSAFDKFQMNPPEKAWDRLSSELDRHQEVVKKHKSDRNRLILITVMIFLALMLSWKFLNLPVKVALTDKVIESSTNSNKQEAEKQPHFKNNNKIQSHDITNILPGTTSNGTKSGLQQSNQSPDDYYTVRTSNDSPTIIHSNLSGIPVSKFNPVNSPGITIGFYSSTGLNDISLTAISGIVATEKVPVVLNHHYADSTIKPFVPAPSPFSLAVYFSPNYTWQILKDNTENNIDDVSMYNDREKAMFSFSAGINMLYNINKNWTIVTGVSYTRNARSMSVPNVYAKMNSANQMYFEYSTSNGIIEVPLDDSHNSMHPGDSILAESKGYQNLKSVSIPVLIRYSVKKSKNTFYAEAGISSNFLVQSKAKMKIDNYEATVINNNYGLKTTSFGYVAGLGLEHHFNHNLNLFMGPVLRGSFTAVTKNSAVDNYPYSIGFNIGMLKHF